MTNVSVVFVKDICLLCVGRYSCIVGREDSLMCIYGIFVVEAPHQSPQFYWGRPIISGCQHILPYFSLLLFN